MGRKLYGFTLEPSTISALDKKRGDIPRSRYVERAIREKIGYSPVKACDQAGE